MQKDKKAFTLAETLITLVIVGVIAALTVPLIMARYNLKGANVFAPFLYKICSVLVSTSGIA